MAQVPKAKPSRKLDSAPAEAPAKAGGPRRTEGPARPRRTGGDGAGPEGLQKARPIALLSLMLCGAYATVALLSYHADDPSWSVSSGRTPENIAGPLGAVVADVLLHAFGLVAWSVVPMTGVCAWLLAGRPLGGWARLLGGLIFAVGSMIGLTLLFGSAFDAGYPKGGAIGITAVELLQAGVGPAGSWFTLLGLILLGLTLLTSLNWQRVAGRAVDGVEAGLPRVTGAGLRLSRSALSGVRSAGGALVSRATERAAPDPDELDEDHDELDDLDDGPGERTGAVAPPPSRPARNEPPPSPKAPPDDGGPPAALRIRSTDKAPAAGRRVDARHEPLPAGLASNRHASAGLRPVRIDIHRELPVSTYEEPSLGRPSPPTARPPELNTAAGGAERPDRTAVAVRSLAEVEWEPTGMPVEAGTAADRSIWAGRAPREESPSVMEGFDRPRAAVRAPERAAPAPEPVALRLPRRSPLAQDEGVEEELTPANAAQPGGAAWPVTRRAEAPYDEPSYAERDLDEEDELDDDELDEAERDELDDDPDEDEQHEDEQDENSAPPVVQRARPALPGFAGASASPAPASPVSSARPPARRREEEDEEPEEADAPEIVLSRARPAGTVGAASATAGATFARAAVTPGALVSGGDDDGGAVIAHVEASTFELPHLGLLDKHERVVAQFDEEELRALADTLEAKLSDFGVSGDVTAIRPGPVITTFEYLPQAGIKLSRIAALEDDIAMALKALRVRIVAPIPGKGVVGFEVPNKKRQTVWIRDLLASDTFRKDERALPMSLGKNVEGKPEVADLASAPHLLVAGTTGSGKSVGVNAMLLSMLYMRTPDELRMILIDPKMLEFELYQDIPHLLHPVVTDPKLASAALKWACNEMDERYRVLARWQTRNIASYNEKVRREMADWTPAKARRYAPKEWPALVPPPPPRTLPYIVIVIDELADLMMVAAKDVEVSIARLAQKARAAGIHLIVATQRPEKTVVTGIIKANMPSRIAFQVRSKLDARIILDQSGAEALLGKGDMLFLPPGVAELKRIHGPFVDDEEVRRVTDFLRAQGAPVYEADIRVDDPDGGSEEEIEYDELYDQAVAFLAEQGKASTSMVQRQFKIGYNRAARIIEVMEKEGLVGPADGAKARKMLVGHHAM